MALSMEGNPLVRKREEAFRDRVLAALEKTPKRSRVLAILNSRLFLWLLTAVLLTIGGSYFSQRQQCLTEADQTIRQRYRLALEMDNRREAIARAVASATSLDDIRKSLEQLPSIYADLKGRSLLDISTEFVALNDNINEESVSQLEQVLAQYIEPITTDEFVEFHSLYMGHLEYRQYDLPALKRFAEIYFEGDRIRSVVHHFSNFRPDCSWNYIAARLLGKKPHHVIQEPRVSVEWIKQMQTLPDNVRIKMGVYVAPALRPPFSKFKYTPQQGAPDKK